MKKFISAVLAASMALAALPAFAAEEEVGVVTGVTQEAGTATAEQAIAVAKTVFDVPEELSRCDYNVFDQSGEQIFDISWSDPDGEKSVNVEVNSRLVPTRYNNYTFDEASGLSEIRKSQLLEAAETFLDGVVPQLSGNLVYSENESGGVRFRFNRYENGIRVEGSYATVLMSRSTGQVRSYTLVWDFDSDFSALAGETVDEAMAYQRLNDEAVRTEYQIFGEKAFPVYACYGGVYVDASGGTFSPASFYDGYKLANFSMDAMDAVAEMASGDGEGGSYRLTQEEIAAVDKMNSLISREKVEELIASMPELSLPEKYELQLRYISQKYYSGEDEETKYIVACDFETENGYADMTLDAETGELKNFYSWNENDLRYYDEETRAYSQEQCRSVADGFIRRIKNVDGYRLDTESVADAAQYVRYIGEIPFPDDYKNAAVSANTGKVTGYYENVPRVEIVTPAVTADRLTAVKNAYDAELVYTYMADADEEGVRTGVHPVLARKLTGKTDFYVLRAEDGEPVDYDGEKPAAVTAKNDETGHPAWNAFDMLRENDITLTGAWSFDDEISGGDFRNLIAMLTGIDAVPYRYIGNEDEESLDGPVTREKAAEMIAKQFGWEPLIDLNIYSVQFTDAAGFTGGIGAAAILGGLGVMPADGNGGFRPGDNLTYGDAFVIAYNLAKLDLYNAK